MAGVELTHVPYQPVDKMLPLHGSHNMWRYVRALRLNILWR